MVTHSWVCPMLLKGPERSAFLLFSVQLLPTLSGGAMLSTSLMKKGPRLKLLSQLRHCIVLVMACRRDSCDSHRPLGSMHALNVLVQRP
ncbi:hypothetical protein ASPSYDRAFT_278549 [Aspergillus sydowii CBS 593.65]|uniref:Uncharacterized protein n=1 Tax=Aspergillus sydowii CBS 593.65 TaxID=1036612 RepID=A0A1L9TX04_9EURO|nr:uncharacterized protein ASPSYDRAFT_278549 [Aspergillus sydowii CBS 593.65]OJJ63922.1 hypothetical protein ASPSYDRAFT_278549 [Aspergillus sydowii CBS 593.65]